ncbi:MAG: DUF92 domain-containing protein, partial [Halobacteria archaeon]|nr:DUF92 domain-containing protein [Halobacteria archaeon]
EEKLAAGVIDDEDARRGLRNVAANGTVPLVAVVAFGMAPLVEAASTNWTVIAKLVFAGSVATVTADTLSSEIGSVHGEPRLITTFEKVPKGTDGGVSWQGEAVVLLSSVLIGAVCVGTGFVGLSESVWVFLGGVGGAHADSVLGATVEGSYRYVDNHVVNLTASVVGSTVSVLAYLLF